MAIAQTESGRAAVDALLTPRHRAELTGFCYRMLGSAFDAEDAVQETLTRAWRASDRFEGRSQARTWLYRIASNVCFDTLKGRTRRATPLDFDGPSRAADGLVGQPLAETTWIEPIPGGRLSPASDDPADQVADRESIKLAFVAALQHLPPLQRAVLILREVLRWQAIEVATLLDTTVASVNSALQRARATLSEVDTSASTTEPTDEAQRELLSRYIDAFERYDMTALTELIKSDATQSMPPYAMWLRGRDEILAWWTGPGARCRGSRLVPVDANGSPAFAQYRRNPDGTYYPWGLQTFELDADGIASFTIFLDTARLFPLFGLPPAPPD